MIPSNENYVNDNGKVKKFSVYNQESFDSLRFLEQNRSLVLHKFSFDRIYLGNKDLYPIMSIQSDESTSFSEFTEKAKIENPSIKPVLLIVVLQMLHSDLSKETLLLNNQVYGSNVFWVRNGEEEFYLEVSIDNNGIWHLWKLQDGSMANGYNFFCLSC